MGETATTKALARDPDAAPLAPEDRAMVDFALKLTREPWAIEKADVDDLRAAGFDDAAVLDIVQVTSYYNYVNRMADGLGVEIEEYWSEEDLTLPRAEFEERRARRRGSRSLPVAPTGEGRA